MPFPAAPFEERYIPEPNSGCWLWLGTLNHKGYGLTGLRRFFASAHRWSWSVNKGPIPQGMMVLHKCDVRCCVNPDHLFLGTHQDNMADMKAKGRASRDPNRSKRRRFLIDGFLPCSVCKLRKLPEEFSIARDRAYGRQSACKKCTAERAPKYSHSKRGPSHADYRQ